MTRMKHVSGRKHYFLSGILVVLFNCGFIVYGEGSCAGDGRVVRWQRENGPTIHYSIDEASLSGIKGGANLEDVQHRHDAIVNAGNAWHDQTGLGLNFVMDGNISATSRGDWFQTDDSCNSISGTQNAVYFQATPHQSTSGDMAAFSYYCKGAVIRHFDIEIYNADSWSTNGTVASNEGDLQGLTTHEFGHTLGLSHFDPATNQDYSTYPVKDTAIHGGAGDPPCNWLTGDFATMCGHTSPGRTTQPRTLQSDDLFGIRTLYSGVQSYEVSVNANDGGQGQGSGDFGNEDSWVYGAATKPVANLGTTAKVRFAYYWVDGNNAGAGLQQVTTDTITLKNDASGSDSIQIGVFYNKHNHRDDEGGWRVKVNGNTVFEHNINSFNDDTDNIANMTITADPNVSN